jgi:DNA-binding response OmpR family regulator
MDDDPAIRRVLRTVLEGEGYEVAEAEGGIQGLRLLRERAFDLVVADLFMPDGDGLEFLTRLKPREAGVPVLVISGGSAHLRSGGLDLARLLGASRTLAKPFRPSEVVAAARALLGAPPAPP